MRQHPARKLVIAPVILLAVAVLACSAVHNLPNPFASPTPTPTPTFTPTITPSPTPTATATPTPKPTGIETEELSDGSTLVHDLDNGYNVTFSEDWAVIALSKDALDAIVKAKAADNPDTQQMVDDLRLMDSDVLRVFGMHKNSKYVATGFPPMMIVVALSDPMAASLPMAGVTAMIEDNVFTGSTDTTWDVVTNANGVEIGIVEGSLKTSVQGGQSVTVQAKVIAFQVNKKLLMIQFETPRKFASEVLPGVDSLIDTIELLEP